MGHYAVIEIGSNAVRMILGEKEDDSTVKVLRSWSSHFRLGQEVFSKGNALDAKITELDPVNRRVKLSVKAAQIDEEKSLIAKFGEGATKSGATLKGIFEKAIGKKGKKEK